MAKHQPGNINDIYNLDDLKTEIIAQLKTYISWWKLRVFKHRHNGRAKAVHNAVLAAESATEILDILNTQMTLFTHPTEQNEEANQNHYRNGLRSRWSRSVKNRPEDPATSGFYTVLVRVGKLADEYCKKQELLQCQKRRREVRLRKKEDAKRKKAAENVRLLREEAEANRKADEAAREPYAIHRAVNAQNPDALERALQYHDVNTVNDKGELPIALTIIAYNKVPTDTKNYNHRMYLHDFIMLLINNNAQLSGVEHTIYEDNGDTRQVIPIELTNLALCNVIRPSVSGANKKACQAQITRLNAAEQARQNEYQAQRQLWNYCSNFSSEFNLRQVKVLFSNINEKAKLLNDPHFLFSTIRALIDVHNRALKRATKPEYINTIQYFVSKGAHIDKQAIKKVQQDEDFCRVLLTSTSLTGDLRTTCQANYDSLVTAREKKEHQAYVYEQRCAKEQFNHSCTKYFRLFRFVDLKQQFEKIDNKTEILNRPQLLTGLIQAYSGIKNPLIKSGLQKEYHNSIHYLIEQKMLLNIDTINAADEEICSIILTSSLPENDIRTACQSRYEALVIERETREAAEKAEQEEKRLASERRQAHIDSRANQMKVMRQDRINAVKQMIADKADAQKQTHCVSHSNRSPTNRPSAQATTTTNMMNSLSADDPTSASKTISVAHAGGSGAPTKYRANGNYSIEDPEVDLYCPISGKLLTDPLVIVIEGNRASHVFNREAILSWLSHNMIDPLTWEPVVGVMEAPEIARFVTNYANHHHMCETNNVITEFEYTLPPVICELAKDHGIPNSAELFHYFDASNHTNFSNKLSVQYTLDEDYCSSFFEWLYEQKEKLAKHNFDAVNNFACLISLTARTLEYYWHDTLQQELAEYYHNKLQRTIYPLQQIVGVFRHYKNTLLNASDIDDENSDTMNLLTKLQRLEAASLSYIRLHQKFNTLFHQEGQTELDDAEHQLCLRQSLASLLFTLQMLIQELLTLTDECLNKLNFSEFLQNEGWGSMMIEDNDYLEHCYFESIIPAYSSDSSDQGDDSMTITVFVTNTKTKTVTDSFSVYPLPPMKREIFMPMPIYNSHDSQELGANVKYSLAQRIWHWFKSVLKMNNNRLEAFEAELETNIEAVAAEELRLQEVEEEEISLQEVELDALEIY